MFYNRERELEKLNEVYSFPGSSFLIIYGRRRVGKTALAREFLKDRLGLYFFAGEKDEALLLEEYVREVEESLSDYLPSYMKPSFKSLEELIGFLLEFSRERKLVVVFDEFQNFRTVKPSFFSSLQRLWDEKKDGSNLMFIAVGSYVGMIKRIFMDRKEPLFGRVDEWIKLRPFDFWTAWGFVRSLIDINPRDFVEFYSALGGMPRYLLYVPRYYRGDSVEALRGLFFDEFAPLREEGLNVLKLEFGRFYRAHFSILEAVSLGYVTPKEISDKTGMKLLTVGKYLSELTNHYEYLTREVPVTENPLKTRKVAYRISDEFFNFWFRFIYHNYTALEEDPDRVFERFKGEFSSFVGGTYERIAREFVRAIDLGFKPERIGRWWHKGEEIDVVAYDRENIVLFEVKWRDLSLKDARRILKALGRKAKLLPLRGNYRFGIIARELESKDELRGEGFLAFDLDDVIRQRSLTPSTSQGP
ncbi:ATP-binding protein [Thermococcus aciditolerans]|uniref:ATP-binding protein n=1 Tax=Thermococcus aciditolerans TaxID=2598455 RepID=A0A5C0SN87_9EURY|nr:ATP-binding protein [Thermococcus aciditolerans]QEK15875.1 ATP-binding protein [Thermococcus aciditolerans]